MFIVLILTTLIGLYLYFLIDYALKIKLFKEEIKEVKASDIMKDLLFEPSQTGRFFDPIVHSPSIGDLFTLREEDESEITASDVWGYMEDRISRTKQ